MKEKKNINGIKDTNESYKGNVSDVIKKIIALGLTLGMVITASQAISMYNNWRNSKTQDTEIANQDKVKKVSLEDVKKLVEEYREAKENNDTEKMKSLEMQLSEGNYFEVLFEDLKKQIVESLGLDPDKVEVFRARDGVFLIDKQKAKGRMKVDHTGQINSSVKYIAANGKNPIIPSEMKDMVLILGNDTSVARYKRMGDLEQHYSNYEYVVDYEPERDDGERE